VPNVSKPAMASSILFLHYVTLVYK
jgi:hypothetical protein